MRILHVPYTYFPDSHGGTEHYVRSLALHLREYGCTSTIAAPSSRRSCTWQDSLQVYRFRIGDANESAQGEPDLVSASDFKDILSDVKPHVVNLHARSAAVSELFLNAARKLGARTVITYHTPTMSCMRGTMLLNGNSRCDGLLDAQRCTACVLRQYGLIEPLPSALSRLPARLGKGMRHLRLQRGPWLALRMRQIVNDHIARTQRFLSLADLVIAPCQWVYELLSANGVPADRLRLCRQGLTQTQTRGKNTEDENLDGSVRLGFFGRMDPTKGIDLLIDVMRQIPQLPLDLSIYGVSQEGTNSFSQKLRTRAQHDNRIRFLQALPADQVLRAMQKLDLVLVPSLVMETGPLVVLEAFAAGTPVIGSDLGGIAELVHSDINGLLLPAGNVQSWVNALTHLSANPLRIQRWRLGIHKPRTMAQVATEMAGFYDELMH